MSCESGDSSLTYTVEGDRVLYIEQIIRTDREALGIPGEMSQEKLYSAVYIAMRSMFEDLDGIDSDVQANGDQILITVKMDLQTADLQVLSDRGFLAKGDVSSDYVSWTKTEEALEGKQIACQPAEK